MLVELSCDKFMEKGKPRMPIEFKEGLNSIIGTDEGGNSIGKSTLLMIIDFVFGGLDYVRVLWVVQNNVGEHTIKFKFEFDGKPYYFSRSTSDYMNVLVCDEHYAPTGEKYSLEQYNNFLRSSYKIPETYGSFRQIVGRFFRIYNRKNMNEKRPLSIDGEKVETSINSFLYMFGLKDKLEPFSQKMKDVDDEYKYLQKAQKYGDRPIVKNEKEMHDLLLQLNNINAELKSIDEGLVTTDSIKIEGLAGIENTLTNLIRQRSKINARLKNLVPDEEAEVAFDPNFEELLHYFPNANIRELQNVENFHKKIKSILADQISEEKEQLQMQLEILNSEIMKCRKERETFKSDLQITSVTTAAELTKAHDLSKAKESIEKLIQNSRHFDETKTVKKEYEDQLKNMRINSSMEYILKLNENMLAMNKAITAPSETTPPRITLSDDGKNYDFTTPQDQGRGTQYKGMVIFDLTMLSTTILPVLIHDSDLLQPVAFNPVDGIANQYAKSKKQIFVAIDKLSSYKQETQKIFKDKMVIELYPGGGELFGEAWNKPK